MTARRVAVLGAVAAAATIAAVVLALTGGKGNPAVAHVGAHPIRRDQLAAAVDHFRRQAEAEGTPFPKDGTARFNSLRNRLLGVLVYREELEQAAARLGVHVTNLEVVKRLNLAGGEEGDAGKDPFTYGSVRAQILYERIYAAVTSKVTGSNSAQLSARRNAAMGRFLDRLRRETQVRYEPGYAPGP